MRRERGREGRERESRREGGREGGERKKTTYPSSELFPATKSSVAFRTLSTQLASVKKMVANVCLHKWEITNKATAERVKDNSLTSLTFCLISLNVSLQT